MCQPLPPLTTDFPLTGERPYMCVEEDCRRAFTTNYSRKTHMLVHKRRTSTSSSTTTSPPSATTYTTSHTPLLHSNNLSSSTTATTMTSATTPNTAVLSLPQQPSEGGERMEGCCSQGRDGDTLKKAARVRDWLWLWLCICLSLSVCFLCSILFRFAW